MIVERVKSGWLAAPDLKITSVNRRTSALVGGYGGWLADQTLLVGGGGYWLANGSHHRELAYGGLVVGIMGRTNRAVGFGAKTLVGFGQSTLSASATQLVFPFPDRRGIRPAVSAPPTLRTVTVHVRDDFFVAEPEANAFVHLSRNFRLTGGVGYRFVGGAHNRNDELGGVSGSVSLQIGGGG
jgi:hypothetical protein